MLTKYLKRASREDSEYSEPKDTCGEEETSVLLSLYKGYLGQNITTNFIDMYNYYVPIFKSWK